MLHLSQFLQYIFGGLTTGSIYALVALGLNIIYNSTGIINFAQGEFVMLGGLLMVTFSKTLGLPMPLAFVLSVAIVTMVGVLMERATIAPIKNPDVLRLIIITLAVSIILKGSAMFIWGKETYYMDHFSGEQPIVFLGASLLPQTLWVLGTLAVIVVLLGFFFGFTMAGKAMRACALNRNAARLVGINDQRMVMLSFGLSAALGAVAGAIVTPITLMDYSRGTMLALKGFGAAILGGLGNSFGSVAAGLLLGIMESLGAGYISSHYKDAIALLILLAVLFLRPSGLFGSAEQAKLKDI